jgi:hypothetical protein
VGDKAPGLILGGLQCSVFLCDSEMSVVMVEPYHSIDMHILDYRTFRCAGCGDTEKRLGLPSKPREPMTPVPERLRCPGLDGPIAVYHLLLPYVRGGQITHWSKARKAGLATVICGAVCIFTGLVGMWIEG